MTSAAAIQQRETDDRIAILYPCFKDEVFRRREHMMWLTSLATACLTVLLAAILAIRGTAQGSMAASWLAAIAVMLFGATIIYMVLQQRDRHRLAKHTLIALEQRWGLYDPLEDRGTPSLYPREWQTDWRRDRSVSIYVAAITLETLFVVAALLMP